MLGLNVCSRYVGCVINPVMILQISRPGLSLAAAAELVSAAGRPALRGITFTCMLDPTLLSSPYYISHFMFSLLMPTPKHKKLF